MYFSGLGSSCLADRAKMCLTRNEFFLFPFLLQIMVNWTYQARVCNFTFFIWLIITLVFRFTFLFHWVLDLAWGFLISLFFFKQVFLYFTIDFINILLISRQDLFINLIFSHFFRSDCLLLFLSCLTLIFDNIILLSYIFTQIRLAPGSHSLHRFFLFLG